MSSFDNNFEGKRVFVSGGSKGIGLACAKRFAAAGAKVFLSSSNEERLAGAASGLSVLGAPECGFHASDLRTLEGCETAANEFLAKWGGCDIFVHSAGATKGGIFPAQPDEEMLEGFALKFHAGVRLARFLWPSLKENNGNVIKRPQHN